MSAQTAEGEGHLILDPLNEAPIGERHIFQAVGVATITVVNLDIRGETVEAVYDGVSAKQRSQSKRIRNTHAAA